MVAVPQLQQLQFHRDAELQLLIHLLCYRHWRSRWFRHPRRPRRQIPRDRHACVQLLAAASTSSRCDCPKASESRPGRGSCCSPSTAVAGKPWPGDRPFVRRPRRQRRWRRRRPRWRESVIGRWWNFRSACCCWRWSSPIC